MGCKCFLVWVLLSVFRLASCFVAGFVVVAIAVVIVAVVVSQACLEQLGLVFFPR